MKKCLPILLFVLLLQPMVHAQSKVPPFNMWTPQVLQQIRDRSTLEMTVTPQAGYWDLFFTSNASASWFDANPPYSEHRNEKIRIHAYLAAPLLGGPYPALVIGHGHGGHADRDLTTMIASLGFVALSIDGPGAGQSTGGPTDQAQSWISVDLGPQYGYLFHYAYAGMRAITALEALAAQAGNPLRINPAKMGVMGASMGGIFTTHINAVDDRVKAAVIIASAGPWHHTLRLPNSWLYNSIYTETRDQPYNGNDPLNSIENIESDPTALQFLNYFDPIRYAPHQNAPVLTVIGTHDEYFPLPSANLMLQGMESAGSNPRFEKRLWLLPNAPHSIENVLDLIPLVFGLSQWLDYCFGNREKPLATPQVALYSESAGLRLEITFAEPASRLSGLRVNAFIGTRVDNASKPASAIDDFKSYTASRDGDRFVVRISNGEVTSSGDLIKMDNILYFATATDSAGLSVSSLFYRAGQAMDLSSNFVPSIRHITNNNVAVPLPPVVSDAVSNAMTSDTQSSNTSYQGIALTNPTSQAMAVRVEARNTGGRILAAEGLINPVFVPLAPNTQQVFLMEEWMGSGARQLAGSIRLGWSDSKGISLAFRGKVSPSELEGIGPLPAAATRVWIPLALEQDPAVNRRLRIVCPSGSTNADVQLIFRNAQGATLESRQSSVSAGGTADSMVPQGSGEQRAASVEVRSTVPISARLEVSGGKDPWSIDGRPASSAIASRLLQPHAEWNGIFNSRLLMINTSANPVSVTLRLFQRDGTAVGTGIQRSIAGNGTLSETVEAIFAIARGTPAGSGWITLETPGGEVNCSVLVVDALGGAAAASPMVPVGGSSWSLPFYVENVGYYTGLALLNPNDTALSMTLTAYKGDGTVQARMQSTLGPRESRVQLVSQWLTQLPAESTGHIVITGTGALSLLSYFGTDDGAALAAIPLVTNSP